MKARNIRWGLFLLLITVVVVGQAAPAPWAGDSGWDSGNVVDYSVNMLSAIFGQVGTSLSGSQTVTQHLFKFFNYGMFALLSLFIAYTVLHHALSSSMADNMSSDGKVPTAFFRIVLSVALLLPISYYNGIEVITMQCVVQGTKFANWVYHEALDAIYTSKIPVVHQSNGNLLLNSSAATKPAASSFGLYIPPTCATSGGTDACNTAQYLYQLMAPSGGTDDGSGSLYSQIMKPSSDNITGRLAEISSAFAQIVAQPANYSASSSVSYDDGTNLTVTIQGKSPFQAMFKEIKQTITFTLPTPGDFKGVSWTQADINAAYAGAFRAALTLMSSAANDKIQFDTDGKVKANLSMNVYNAFFGTLYQSYSAAYKRPVSINVSKLASPEQRDWSMAGAFIVSDLEQTSSNKGSSADGTTATNVSKLFNISSSSGDNESILSMTASDALDPAITMTYTGTAGQGASADNSDGSLTHSKVGGALAVMAGINPIAQVTLGILDGFIYNDMDHVKGLSKQVNSSGTPIAYLQSLGDTLIQNGLAAYMTIMSAVVGLVGLGCMLSGEQPMCDVILASLSMVMPFISTFMNLSIVAGVVLALYIPLYPTIVFLFCVLSWFISVVEAMIAGPLICIGITHPSGHMILGKAEQAMMLLLGVFLRPVLMIVALFAAAAVSYVGLRLAVTGFTIGLDTIMGSSSHTGVLNAIDSAASSVGLVTNIVTYPALIAFLVILIIKVLEMSFGLISSIPMQILNWIGGPTTSDRAMAAVQGVQSGISSAGDKMGGAVSGAAESSLKSASSTAATSEKAGAGHSLKKRASAHAASKKNKGGATKST